VPTQVVLYRHRSVSKPMFVVFVLLLLIPMLIAGAAAVQAAFRVGVSNLDAYHAAKALLWFVPVVWLVLKPAGRIRLDSEAQQLRYEPGWPKPPAAFPFEGLVAVKVGEEPTSSLQRLVLVYRDHSEQALTDAFSYGRAHHHEVARALNGIISQQHAPKA
jgi:hypothetical protein